MTPIAANELDFAKGSGLIPAVVQNADTGAVLMVGCMNAEALEETVKRERVVFFSRTKGRLWEKGEVSGNSLVVIDIRADCDRDSLLVLARPKGPTCHRGTVTCFGPDAFAVRDPRSFLGELEKLIEERNRLRPAGSYTTSLFDAGVNRIAQKVGEEALELALAAVAGPEPEVIAESADLLFHLLVMLHARGLTLRQVVGELQTRHPCPPEASAPSEMLQLWG